MKGNIQRRKFFFVPFYSNLKNCEIFYGFEYKYFSTLARCMTKIKRLIIAGNINKEKALNFRSISHGWSSNCSLKVFIQFKSTNSD